jgi:hypothetical protein
MPGYGDPPNRFSSTNQPTRRRGPSIVKHLRKLLEKKITYEDPETKQMVTGKIALVIALREILNACQGDQNAIEDITERIDGKVEQKLVGEGFENKVINIIHNNGKPEENLITKIRNQSPAVSE